MTSSKKHDDRGPKVASPPETPEIAASLARIGWPVFPVTIYAGTKANGFKRHKVPAVKWKAEATTDVATVHAWWAGEHSGRWIGVYAGAAGIVVLDLDPAKGDGLSGVESLEAAKLAIPKTFNYPTHRPGGRHYVYAAPEGVELTIARDLRDPSGKPLEGVDVRSGAGLMVYYGPEITGPPPLASAPSWLLVHRGATSQAGTDRAPSADEDLYRARLPAGKPDKEIRKTIAAVPFPSGAAHDNMLEVVTTLVGLGLRGEKGVAQLLDETRERYAGDHPDRPRDWDNAVSGSIRRLGLPPTVLAMTKEERKDIKRRNDPAVIEERNAERKGAYRAKKHREAMTMVETGDADAEVDRVDHDDRPLPGDRVLEDAPLASEFAKILADRWAYADGLGIMRYVVKHDGAAGVWRPAEEHSLIEAVRRLLIEVEIDEHEVAALRSDNKAIDKARTLLGRGRAAAVARFVVGILAEREPEFDAHPDLINTPTGVVDLRTSELRPHDPTLFLTKMTAVGYDPDADMTMWKKALEALPPKVAHWMQLRFGQAMTGYTPEDDTLIIIEGAGNNGKTTALAAPSTALGDYVATLPERLLLADPGDHPTTLMTLMGARMGIIEELPEGRSLNVKRLKDVVGTPKITARRMRQDDITFRNTSCLFLSTNYLPIVAETDHGTWRRLALVRFPYRFISAKKYAKKHSKNDRIGDPRVRRYFEHNADAGVLRWMIEGAKRWYDEGQAMTPEDRPKRVIADTEAWRLDADPILAYSAAQLIHDDGFAIPAADLADDFNAWLERRGHKPWSQQTINSRFGGHVSMDGIERRPVKFSLALRPSRPAAIFSQKPIPVVTTCWRGLRFREEVGEGRPMSQAERDVEALREMEARMNR